MDGSSSGNRRGYAEGHMLATIEKWAFMLGKELVRKKLIAG